MSRETPTLTLVNWNVEWASPGSVRFQTVHETIVRHRPDVVCVTEGEAAVLPRDGHSITSHADYGHGDQYPHRRKVLLWSRRPWANVDTLGHSDLPGGRFVAGDTETPIGRMRVVGVCIPWRDAHVRTGRKDRQPWEDHVAYLDGLSQVLSRTRNVIPSVVVGDFNQRVPRKHSPAPVYERLTATFDAWHILTAGLVPGTTRFAIDHVAVDDSLEAASVAGWSGTAATGERLSDHDGYCLTLRGKSPPSADA